MFLISCSQIQKESVPPNVIIILTDDQAWGDLSYHGNTNLSTPHIDQIALQGTVVENFYVQPVCSPTRAEILTGQFFPKLGVYATSAGGERMNLGIPTIADIFKNAGYATAAYGKWHNGSQPPYHPNSRGFEDYYGFCSGHWGNYFSPMIEHNGKITQADGYLVDDFVNHGIDFIAAQNGNPFFLYLPLNTPHSPMQVPDTFWNAIKNRSFKMSYHGVEKEDEQFTRAALAMVENIDWNVGRLNTYLKEHQLEDNTIVVFMSDNGPASWRWNGGLKGKKGSTDEGGVKSPFFIKWPKKISSGTISNQLMGSVDVLPTLINLAGITLEDSLDIDGIDLSTHLLDKKSYPIDRIIYNHWNNKTSIRTQNFRLDHENRLFDISKDIGQTKDISIDFKAITDSLIKIKNRWIAEMSTANSENSKRRFPIGDSIHKYVQLPARDGKAHGKITRSNRYPNDSFFTNWVDEKDSITWNVDILNDETYEVYLYYTCKPEDLGTELELHLNNNTISTIITEAYDPPLLGEERDRSPRIESYVKDFKSLKMGEISVKKGEGTLSLRAITIPGNSSIDFRLLDFQKVEP